jgi:branched-chain amino acid transport system ATP-binding protein
MLNICEIRKSFGGVQALRGCSLNVAKGTITGLIGPNGAGKTTLFNVICGIFKPDGGEIRFNGERIDGQPSHLISQKGILRTFQIPRVLNRMTVMENLLLYPQKQRGERLWTNLLQYRWVLAQEREIQERAIEILEFVNLHHLKNSYAMELSGGQKKLLELARVLMADPQMILLDEPGAGVNPTLMNELIKRILELQEKGLTFLLIEHDMDLVLKLCDPVVVMTEGKKLTEGIFAEIRRDERVLEAYLGRRQWDS